MGPKKNYLVRQFSSIAASYSESSTKICIKDSPLHKLGAPSDSRLDPMYVTGLADGESSFYLRFNKRSTNRTG